MSEETELAVKQNGALVVAEAPLPAMSLLPAEVKRQVQLIQRVMRDVMKDGTHYGKVPGCGDKPTLLQPGADKLCLTFRFDAEFETLTAVREKDFLLFEIRCTLYHGPTGMRVASGMGACSSRESKYGLRDAPRICPKCGVGGAIIKGKAEYGGGFLCFGKKGGCGAKFPDNDQSILGQKVGKVPVENVWEQYNTILKMACKRAKVAAVLNGTAASDIFTQDIEDMDWGVPEVVGPPVARATHQRQASLADRITQDRPEEGPGAVVASGDDDTAFLAAVDAAATAELEAMAQPDATDGTAGRETPAKATPDGGSAYGAMLQRFAKAKAAIGEEAYRRILGTESDYRRGFAHANQIPTVAVGNAILEEMREFAKQQKGQP